MGPGSGTISVDREGQADARGGSQGASEAERSRVGCQRHAIESCSVCSVVIQDTLQARRLKRLARKLGQEDAEAGM